MLHAMKSLLPVMRNIEPPANKTVAECPRLFIGPVGVAVQRVGNVLPVGVLRHLETAVVFAQQPYLQPASPKPTLRCCAAIILTSVMLMSGEQLNLWQ